jgi:ferredoxin
MASLKIEVNRATCCGSGKCWETDPSIFNVDDDGIVILLLQDVDESRRAQAELAEKRCPTKSVKVARQ